MVNLQMGVVAAGGGAHTLLSGENSPALLQTRVTLGGANIQNLILLACAVTVFHDEGGFVAVACCTDFGQRI